MRDHIQDMATYRALSPWVDRVYIIVTSEGRRRHVSHDGPVIGLHIPYGRRPALRWLRFVFFGWLIGRRLLRTRRIDVVMAAEPFAGGVLGVALAKAWRKPLIVHIQGDLLDLPAALLGRARVTAMRWFTVAVARRATLVRCISRRVLETAAAAGIASHRLRLLPIRVDLRRFDPTVRGDEVIAMRIRLGVAPGELLIVSAGSLTVHKGYATLIEAVAALRPFVRVRLVIAGEGPERSRLERAIAAHEFGDIVSLIGWVSYADVPALMGAGDIYVQPSFDEGIPRAVLEAMAMCRPVVASNVGGIPELVRARMTGTLVPAGDPAALASAIKALCADAALRAEFGRAGRTVALEFDADRGIRNYAEVLLEAATHRAPSAA